MTMMTGFKSHTNGKVVNSELVVCLNKLASKFPVTAKCKDIGNLDIECCVLVT